MAPSTPVANKKAHGLAQKSKEPLLIETDEFVDEFHAIEKDLKQYTKFLDQNLPGKF